MDFDSKIGELRAKIEVERKVKEGAENMLRQLKDVNAIQQCDITVRESQRRLDFLLSEMYKLQQRRLMTTNVPMDPEFSTNPHTSSPGPSRSASIVGLDNTQQTLSARGSTNSLPAHLNAGRKQRSVDVLTSSPDQQALGRTATSFHPLSKRNSSSVFSSIMSTLGLGPKRDSMGSNQLLSQSENELAPSGPPATTPFGFLRSDALITNDKVKFKIEQVQHHLDVESKVKAGSEKMLTALGNISLTDPKRKELQSKIDEAKAKISLLTKAVASYQAIYVNDLPDTNPETGESGIVTSASMASLKQKSRQFSGKLKIRFGSAMALPGLKSSKTDTYIIVRADQVEKGRTRHSKGRWNEEVELHVEKAQEIQFDVYEKHGGIIAMVWFRLEDLVDELNRLKEQQDSATPPGTPPAPRSPVLPLDQDALQVSRTQTISSSSSKSHIHQPQNDGIDAWIGLEPSGSLQIRISFVSEEAPKKRKSGVVRRRPVQKIFLKHGHRFSATRSYQVLKCAACSEFLISGEGYQCSLCNYLCHKKCQSLVPKCISKGSNEKDEKEDGEKPHFLVKHSIPHRFEPTSGLAVHWCCHCGVMLPLGKKGYCKCTECHATCHQECAPLVPNYCGLSSQFISQLRSLELMESKKKVKPITSPGDVNDARPSRNNSQEQFGQVMPPPLSNNASMQNVFSGPSDLSSQHLHHHSSSPQIIPDSSRISFVPQPLDGHQNSQMSYIPTQQPQYAPIPFNMNTSTSTQPQPQQPVSYANNVPSKNQRQTKQERKPRGDSIMPLSSGPKGIGLDDFNFLAVLGKGNFGKVMLAEEKYSKSHYAIKVLKKEFIIENDEVESTKSEKRVFLIANRERHPFLVNLHSCFQTESRIYFVMEFVSGGDLMFHIQQRQFSEKRAKFYACEVLLALEYFHQNNIVYRDLKLDNILLTMDGHIKIADYGLCKENMGFGATTTTFCGTPEFMSPEILAEKPYGRAVDWWAFGVLIYEMLLGQSPFKGDDEEEIFDAILKQDVNYPSHLPADAVSLLKALLIKDPARRLGGGPRDALDIKAHPFFAGVDWQAMYNLRIPPPYKPQIVSETDVSNFDEEFTREMPVLTPCTSILSTANQEEFRGFTYISDWAQATRAQVAATIAMKQQRGGGSS